MRSILIVVLTGIVVFSLLSSCASGPTGPLAPGALRLVSMEVAGNQAVRSGTQFPVNIYFKADGNPEIKRVCFISPGEDPNCLRNMEVGTEIIKASLYPKVSMFDPSYRLECYVEYIRDGNTWTTNRVGTQINVILPRR